MWVLALVLPLFLATDTADEEFLLERLGQLRQAYDDHARKQTAAGRRARAAVVREIAHLPFQGKPLDEAGDLLARIVSEDPSYAVRADAARAIGRVGTPGALRALYRSVFGADGRSRRYRLLYTVLPDALASLRNPAGTAWITEQVLIPVSRNVDAPLLREAASLRTELVVLTIEGLGRAQLRILRPELVTIAASGTSSSRAAAVRALGAMGIRDPAVDRAVRAPQEALRAAAAGFPGLSGEQARRLLGDNSAWVRREAVRRLERRPPPEATPLLVERLRLEQDPALRLDLAEALNRHTGKEFGTDFDRWWSWWVANRDRFKGPASSDKPGHTYFFKVGLRTNYVVFLIDASASMERTDVHGVSRQERARKELAGTLRRLPPATRVRLVVFSAAVRAFPDFDSAPVDRRKFDQAIEWLGKIKSAGATNTYGALMRVLEQEEAADTIVLLSDGNPYRCSYRGRNYSEHEQILAEVRHANERRGVRIHTVALLTGALKQGEDEDAAGAVRFLSRLALQNRGEFREIR